jgi:hypothetical protein
MELRREQRVQIARQWYNNPEKERFYFIFDTISIPCRIVDINPGGIGFETYKPDPVLVRALEGGGNLIIKLYFGEETLMFGVTAAWHTMVGESPGILKGGLRIDVITPEDRLKVYEFIEKAGQHV